MDRQWDRRTRITDRKFEVNELVGMFLGTGPQRLYELLTFLYLFGLLYWGQDRCTRLSDFAANHEHTSCGSMLRQVGLCCHLWNDAGVHRPRCGVEHQHMALVRN